MKARFRSWTLGGVMPLLSLLAASPLSARADDFPDGPGKVIILRACGKCHSTEQIARQQKTEENWQATVVRMAGRGADVTADEVTIVVKYLSANFLKVADASKVNINKASAKDLVALGFTDAEAAAIIDYKTRHGDFRLWADMLQIYGVDGEKCEALKDKMEF